MAKSRSWVSDAIVCVALRPATKLAGKLGLSMKDFVTLAQNQYFREVYDATERLDVAASQLDVGLRTASRLKSRVDNDLPWDWLAHHAHGRRVFTELNAQPRTARWLRENCDLSEDELAVVIDDFKSRGLLSAKKLGATTLYTLLGTYTLVETGGVATLQTLAAGLDPVARVILYRERLASADPKAETPKPAIHPPMIRASLGKVAVGDYAGLLERLSMQLRHVLEQADTEARKRPEHEQIDVLTSIWTAPVGARSPA